jgi:uncharacterized protein
MEFIMTQQCEMPTVNSTTSEIKEILAKYKTIAVVGLSPKEDRPSFRVAKYLQSQGYKIYPVNPTVKEVLGEKSYPDLKSIPDKIDIVDVFRDPAVVVPVAKDAVEIGAKVLWFQELVINNEAAEIAQKAGLKVIQNKCILKEHRKLFVF